MKRKIESKQKRNVYLTLFAYMQLTCVILLVLSNFSALAAFESKAITNLHKTILDEISITKENRYSAEFSILFSDRVLEVVRSKDNKEFLSMNLAGEYDKLGTLFIDKDYQENSENMVIYGHSSKSNMKQLTPLKNAAYVLENQLFTIDKGKLHVEYQIIAYLNRQLPEAELPYLNTSFRTTSDFLQFLEAAKRESIIDFAVGDFSEVNESITIVTCDLRNKNKRWIIIAIPLMNGKEKT